MADSWVAICALLSDPAAARVLAEALQGLPARVRRVTAPAVPGDPGRRDLEHAELWKRLAQERDER